MQDILQLLAEVDPRLQTRSPVPEDLASLPAQVSCVARLRHTHHLLARVLAEGKTPVQAAALSGYSLSTIYSLQKDPAFQELLAHYKAQVDDIFASIHERLGALGIAFLDEIQERLEHSPETFSLSQLRQMAEFLLDRSVAPAKGAAKGGSGGGGNLSIKIDFGSDGESARQKQPSGEDSKLVLDLAVN